MRKLWRFVMCALPVAMLLGGCYKEDINELKRRADEHDAQLKTINEWKETINTEIATIQQLIAALQANDHVTGVTENATGYVISFKSGRTINIKHGEKGATGATGPAGTSPVMTAAYHAGDDTYYWKCNGEWVLCDQGNKVRAVGDSGVTPVIGLRAGRGGDSGEATTDHYWTVTLGDATTDILGPDNKPLKATGDHGDSHFQDVNNDDDKYLVVTLTDDTVISLKKYMQIGLTWDAFDTFHQGVPQTVQFEYTGREAGDEHLYPVYVIGVTDGWAVNVIPENRGSFKVTPPNDLNGLVNARALIALLDKDGDIIRTYQLDLSMKSLQDYAVGDIYYEYGIPVGVVFQANNGTEGSGLLVQPSQMGPIGAGLSSPWSRASDWAEDFGTGWRLPTLEEIRTLYNVWTAAGGAVDGNTFNAVLTGDILSGDALGMQVSGSKIYWTGEELGFGNVNAKIFRFASGIGTGDPGDDASGGHSKRETGYYARAVKTF